MDTLGSFGQQFLEYYFLSLKQWHQVVVAGVVVAIQVGLLVEAASRVVVEHRGGGNLTGKVDKQMKKASQHFTEEEKKKISQAVKDAESKTAAEIIPVAATSSGRYDRAEDIIGLVIGIIVMVNALAFAPIELLGVSTKPTQRATPEDVVAVTPSAERPVVVLPEVVERVYLLPIKLTAGVPAVN